MWYKQWPFKQSYVVTVYFKVIQYGCETFQHCKIIQLKTFNLELNVSLISNKAPNLYSVICAEMNAASVKNKNYCKRKGVVISSCLLLELLLFIVKRFYILLYNPICILHNPVCSLLCLRYWESINIDSKLIKVK